MCGKANSKVTPAEIVNLMRELGIVEEDELNYDKYSDDNSIVEKYDEITPGKTMYVAYLDHDTNHFIVDEMRWGINSFGGQSTGFIFNTKSESILEKNTLSSFKNNRAFIIVNGFYEKQKKDGKVENELYITNNNNQIIMPVIYKKNEWGKHFFTILTKKASNKIDEFHERQPIILKKKYMKFWLKYDKFKTKDVLKLIVEH